MRMALQQVHSGWWLLKLTGMSTILREWVAVHSMSNMPMREVILTAKVRHGQHAACHSTAN